MKLIVGNKLVLWDQKTPDAIPGHYVDVEFHAESEYRIHSGQILTIPDITWDSKCELFRQPNAYRIPRDNGYITAASHRCGIFWWTREWDRNPTNWNLFSQFWESGTSKIYLDSIIIEPDSHKWDKKSSIFHDLDLNRFIWSRCTDNVFQGRIRLLPGRW